jgi:hypothetical protein
MFIFPKQEDRSVGKFRNKEKTEVDSIVASLTIKRIPDALIIQHISNKTGKTITTRSLCNIRQRIKKESYKWYSQLREGEYEYIHEFRERINEIIWLQKKHHEIIDSPKESTVNKQSSLAELHRLNITLSNYFDVAPAIVNGFTVSTAEPNKTESRDKDNIIV